MASNVLFIMSDEHQQKAAGCYANRGLVRSGSSPRATARSTIAPVAENRASQKRRPTSPTSIPLPAVVSAEASARASGVEIASRMARARWRRSARKVPVFGTAT